MTKSRTEAFSDGVFAIAITLLVLEIKIPEGDIHTNADLNHVLYEARFSFLTYFFSFLVVGVFWVAHHRIFDLLREVNHYLLWSNVFYLLTIAIIPFPASVLAQHPFFPTSIFVYSGTLFIAGMQHFVILHYAYRHPEVKSAGYTKQVYRGGMAAAAVGPACYLLSVIVGFWSTGVAFACILFSLIFYIFLVPFIYRADRGMKTLREEPGSN